MDAKQKEEEKGSAGKAKPISGDGKSRNMTTIPFSFFICNF
jgi:hypothetical protein